jgi:CheY-like chemotaxis protein
MIERPIILFVEDNVMVREVGIMALSKSGEVVEAEDGVEALEKLGAYTIRGGGDYD